MTLELLTETDTCVSLLTLTAMEKTAPVVLHHRFEAEPTAPEATEAREDAARDVGTENREGRPPAGSSHAQ